MTDAVVLGIDRVHEIASMFDDAAAALNLDLHVSAAHATAAGHAAQPALPRMGTPSPTIEYLNCPSCHCTPLPPQALLAELSPMDTPLDRYASLISRFRAAAIAAQAAAPTEVRGATGSHT